MEFLRNGNCINHKTEQIESYEKMWREDPSFKAGFGPFRLSNFYDQRKKLQECEIILTKDWNKLINEHRPGRFILVGSELHMMTWPNHIRRLKKPVPEILEF